MPHIVVEYSDNLPADVDIRAMMADMHAALGAEDSVDPARVKSRAVPLEVYLVGNEPSGAAMIHIAVRLMPRPAETARRMAQTMQDIARRHAAAFPKACAVTAEIVTLDPETYRP